MSHAALLAREAPRARRVRAVAVRLALLVPPARGHDERARPGRAAGARGGGEDAVGGVLVLVVPGGERAAGLGGLAEDEAEEDVDAADGEEEEGGHERELVHVVGEHGRAEAAWGREGTCQLTVEIPT